MGEVLVHRGPDASGLHVDGDLGLVSRRLRIVDPRPMADQPMTLPELNLWLIFNGEIHNQLELARELEAHGVQLRTRCDTEVVLWAWELWGPECFDRFNGMWALALWDGGRRRLVLSRDRFGIKPLCLSLRGARVAFASEPKAILAAFPDERTPDPSEVESFLAGGFPDASERTFFAGIRNVAPGTWVTIDTDALRAQAYWRFCPGQETPAADTEERFAALLTDSVRLRRRSDAPVGICLSGGLDSTAIAGLAARDDGEPIEMFTVRQDDPARDETAYAKLAARRCGGRLHIVTSTPDRMLDTMREIVWHHDAPTPVRGRYGQWFVMQEAARHVRVVLDGQGSDELLAGYPRDIPFWLRDRLQLGPRGLRSALETARQLLGLLHVAQSRRWFLLTAARRNRRDPRAHGETPYDSSLNNALWNGLRHYGLPELLHSEDALSMAFSLESRTPFLDHRLVEFCFRLPFDQKIAGGYTKSLLRRAMTGTIPPEVQARRRKIGFLSPVAAWLRLDANARATRDLLLEERALGRGLCDRRERERELWRFHRGPLRYANERAPDVWRWITLEQWYRDFVDAGGRALRLPASGGAEPIG